MDPTIKLMYIWVLNYTSDPAASLAAYYQCAEDHGMSLRYVAAVRGIKLFI